MMKRILILLGLAMPMVAAADMGVPPNAMDAAVDLYSMTSDLGQYIGREFSGELLTQLCETIKEYLKKWDAALEIEPGMDWSTVIDCRQNKTEKEREHLWNSCMFAAYELYAQGKTENMRARLVAQMVRQSHNCIPGAVKLSGDMICELGTVNRCLGVGVDQVNGSRVATCCVISPDAVNAIRVKRQDSLYTYEIKYDGAVVSSRQSFVISDGDNVTLSDFDDACVPRP